MSVPAETKRYLAEKGIKPHPRHLAVALQRANEIQRRKEVENLILSRIESLTTLPTDTTSTAANPSSEDVYTLKHALIPFQPSDYDDLIAERNVKGLCGYPLCPKPPRKLRGSGAFRVAWAPSGTQAAGKQATVVSKAEYEKWCSNDCIERAMYLRIQLIEKPSWEREAYSSPKFELLDERRAKKKAAEEAKKQTEKDTAEKEEEGKEEKEKQADSIEEKMERLNIKNTPTDPKSDRKQANQDELAMERGDASNTTKYYDPKGEVSILEKETAGAKNEPPSSLNPGAGAIEGYEPKYMHNPSGRRRPVEGEEEDYDEDEDNDILPQI